jgi:hypothetical protein
LGVAGNDCVEEASCGSLFGVVAEGPPESDGDDEDQGDDSENQWSGFVRYYWRRIEK